MHSNPLCLLRISSAIKPDSLWDWICWLYSWPKPINRQQGYPSYDSPSSFQLGMSFSCQKSHLESSCLFSSRFLEAYVTTLVSSCWLLVWLYLLTYWYCLAKRIVNGWEGYCHPHASSLCMFFPLLLTFFNDLGNRWQWLSAQVSWYCNGSLLLIGPPIWLQLTFL